MGYLEQQSFANKSKFIAVDQPRAVKTMLLTGAFDERFALIAPAVAKNISE